MRNGSDKGSRNRRRLGSGLCRRNTLGLARSVRLLSSPLVPLAFRGLTVARVCSTTAGKTTRPTAVLSAVPVPVVTFRADQNERSAAVTGEEPAQSIAHLATNLAGQAASERADSAHLLLRGLPGDRQINSGKPVFHRTRSGRYVTAKR